jgi:hypothetical protein
MARTLKVYSWLDFHPGIEPGKPWVSQASAVVAAHSMAEAARLASSGGGFPPRSPRDMLNLSETGNLTQIIVALGAPGIVFHAPMFSADYAPSGGRPLDIPPADPDTLVAECAARYPHSDMPKRAARDMPGILAAWDAARLLWPGHAFAS